MSVAPPYPCCLPFSSVVLNPPSSPYCPPPCSSMLLCCPLPSPSIVLLLLLCSLPSPPSTPCMLSTPVVRPRPAYSLRSLLSPPSSSFPPCRSAPLYCAPVLAYLYLLPRDLTSPLSAAYSSPSSLPAPRLLLLHLLDLPPCLQLPPWPSPLTLASQLLPSPLTLPSCVPASPLPALTSIYFLHLLRFPPPTSYPPHPSISSPVHLPSLEPPSTSRSPLLALSPSHLPDPLLIGHFIETKF
ncbi:hypothetical protein O6H91_Y246400 [Diphasiastrum complanatum]|nr:hypothetical protein O6H91_Y246400 [Diphasiastrum complanatum]